jgi:hypothetical protein
MRPDGTAIDSLPAPAPDRTHRAFVLMTSDGPRWSFPQENVTAPYLPGGTVQGIPRRTGSSSPARGSPCS